MTVLTRRLSVPELSHRILEMAKTGVYRESVFEALQPVATKRQIREAIAHAKRFGLHSVAALRDAELGTYYQLDAVKYESLKHALYSPEHLGTDDELVQRLSQATQSLQRMVAVARGVAGVLGLLAIACWVSGWQGTSLGLGSSALGAIAVWSLQRVLLRQTLLEQTTSCRSAKQLGREKL
ncbi:MAG: hypothetical protein IGS50_02770 [Synechococcales cyanobacterium C42_A2020_086]|nr:hypothetical protein [Synechococcales cyanobacterium C42_A2020_086]